MAFDRKTCLFESRADAIETLEITYHKRPDAKIEQDSIGNVWVWTKDHPAGQDRDPEVYGMWITREPILKAPTHL